AAAGLAPNVSGFEVLALNPDDLTPIDGQQPQAFVTNLFSGIDEAVPDGVQALTQRLKRANTVLLVQSFGSPKALSTDWNDLAAAFAGLGATKQLAMSLNNPSLPGLHSPTGYAFAAYTG